VTTADLTDQSIRAYLGDLASAAPAPGGGSVAALVGALGAALVTMVTDLTLGKESFALAQDEMAGIRLKSERLRARLQELVSLDASAYKQVAAAMKLPKATDEDKWTREAKLQQALIQAAEVPLETAEAAVEVAELCIPAAESGNPHAVSDAGVAVILAEAAAQSAALNVKINLNWISDEAFRQATWSRTEIALSATAKLKDCVLSITYAKLK
jgi:methenyltetrahydrofolate cyclohydrolase